VILFCPHQAGWRAKYGYAVEFPDQKENGTLRVSL
jgi:hypothetical protein